MTAAPKVVLFDMGGVLFSYDPVRRLRYISELCGLPESEVQARIFETDFDQKCETGVFSALESHAEFNRLCGSDLSFEDYKSAIVSAFEPNGIVFGLAKELSSSCVVAGLTNNGYAARDGLAELHPDFRPIFANRAFCSAELGVRKPNPAVFDAVLLQLEQTPEDVLFIDDDEPNLRAALEVGFQVHHYFDSQTLETDLRSFGLL